MPTTGASARVRLITTRRGTWVDEGLFPEARREGLELIERAARDLGDSGIAEMLQGHTRRLKGTPLGERLRRYGSDTWGDFGLGSRWRRHWNALALLGEKVGEHDPPEERAALTLAAVEAPERAEKCGACARLLRPGEPAYFGAEVYVGFPPLRWKMMEPRVCQPRYQRTVLCGACAPGWLSSEGEGVVRQLCAGCERPMVYRLTPAAMGRTFCSEPCGRAYQGRLRKERRAQAREKVCEVCGRDFTASRKDARTCSPGCKQWAYRQRKREANRNW